MLRRLGPHAANALTAVRVLLTPVFAVAVCAASGASIVGGLACVVFVIVAASDVVDGRLARHWGSASDGGRTFDHLADIGFILTALSTYAFLGIAPWWVPATIGASFAFYVFDSRSRATIGSPGLIGSHIGHVAGILNYSLVGVLVFNNTAGIHLLLEAILDKLFWLVPIYSTLAVAARLAGRRQIIPVTEAG